MIKLYVWKTPNGYKAPILLEEIAVAGDKMDYELVPINIQKGEQKTAEFVEMNPNGKIPVLLDDDVSKDEEDSESLITIFESGAILEYLAEKSGVFMSKDLSGRYAVKEWLTFAVAGIGPSFGQLAHYKKFATEQVPYAIERATTEAKRVLGVMNARLGESDFLAGEYSIADISAWTWTRTLKSLDTIDFSEFPNVERWYASIESRPAVQKGIEKVDAACVS